MASSEDLLQSRVIVRRRAGSTEPGASRGSALSSESAPTPAPSARNAVESGRTPTSVRPTKIGRFSVLEPIGQGGMGVVYGCYDDQLDRKVAVKVMLRRLVGSEQGQIRLLREAQAMARLSHPNIVTVLEAGSFDDQVYLAMEFVRGVTLDRWVSESDHAWPEIVEAFIQAGRGLAAAHRAGIVHRDFKPESSRFSLRTPSSRETPRISSLGGIGGKIGCPGLPLLAPG